MLKERFFNAHKFSNSNNSKSISILRKGVCSYEYMGDWEKLNATSLPEKEDFYVYLKIEDITDADYTHAGKVCKDFEMKNLGEYHYLYVENDTLLLADVSVNFRNMFLKICNIDTSIFFYRSGTSMASSFNKN